MHLRGRTPPRDAVHHPLFARFYARFSVAADARGGIVAYREELLAGLSGRVVEIGAGNGLNFAHYPGAVSEVVALEPERSLRQLAVRAALRAEVPVDVVPGAAEAIPMKNEGFDAAVASLVLCTVRDLPRALAEIRHGTRWPRSRRRASRWARTAGCGFRRRARRCRRRRACLAWPGSRSRRSEPGGLGNGGRAGGPYRGTGPKAVGPGPLVRVAPRWVASRWFGSRRRAAGPVSGVP